MSFLDKPNGVGSQLNIYMFTPKNLLKNLRTMITQPRYFINRLRVMLYQIVHPGYPWLTAASIKLIEEFLDADKTGFEWGSGESTVWFAKRVRKLISIEHNDQWHRRVLGIIEESGITNVDYRLVSVENGCSEYAQQIVKGEQKFDFVLVDGECRGACFAEAAQCLRPGGYLVLDNADLEYNVPELESEKFRIIRTDNGVWRTDIYIYDQGS